MQRTRSVCREAPKRERTVEARATHSLVDRILIREPIPAGDRVARAGERETRAGGREGDRGGGTRGTTIDEDLKRRRNGPARHCTQPSKCQYLECNIWSAMFGVKYLECCAAFHILHGRWADATPAADLFSAFAWTEGARPCGMVTDKDGKPGESVRPGDSGGIVACSTSISSSDLERLMIYLARLIKSANLVSA